MDSQTSTYKEQHLVVLKYRLVLFSRLRIVITFIEHARSTGTVGDAGRLLHGFCLTARLFKLAFPRR
jgi:hypothetical protein